MLAYRGQRLKTGIPCLRIPSAVSMLFLCLGASAWASPFWSLDYLYEDIIRAKEGRHRIYEVLVDSCEFIREDTAQVPNRTLFLNIPAYELDDTTAQPFDVYKLRFKVLSTITADPFPVHIPLVAIDKRMRSRVEWNKCSDWKWPKSADFIVVLDRKNVLRILEKHGVIR